MNDYVEIFLFVPAGDQTLTEQDLKWVTNFSRILQVGLNQFHQAKTKIVNTIYTTDELEKVIQKKPLVIQLLLLENMENSNDIQNLIEKKGLKANQILRLQCFPIKLDYTQTETIKTINFFEESSGKTIKIDENIEKIRDDVWLKFLDLSLEIGKIISGLTQKETENTNKKSVFLAYTSSDQNLNKKIIEREISQLGYTIYDPSKLINDTNKLKDFISQSLSKAILSLHIIGNSEYPLVQGQDISVVEFQNKLFVDYISANKNAQLFRLIWIPPDIKPKTERQKAYIESFMHLAEAMGNTEIVQTPIEIFKSIIQRKLVSKAITLSNEPKKEMSNSKSVYFIYNQSDSDKVNKIKEEFEKKNITILKTEKAANSIENLRLHQKNLVQCDAVLIFQFDNNQLWLNSKISDILKAPGIGRKKKYAAKALFAPDNSATVTGLRDMIVLDTKGSISQSIQPIIEILENYDTSR